VRGAEKGKEEAADNTPKVPKVALFTPQKSVKLLVEVIALNVPSMFPQCSLIVPSLFPQCALNVP
jgi:hypothetical protein